MKLKKIIQDLDLTVKGSKDVEISGLCSDSRKVAPGNLFIAKRGMSFDAAQFIPQAVQAGASAIATDIYDPFVLLPQIIHPNLREIEAKLANNFFGRPSQELFVIGVTGTKGKTTSSYLIKHLLDGLGLSSGLISTVETVVQESRFFSSLTTHDPIFNQKLLKEMVLKKCKGAVLEVSSHGLDQGRVDEIDFDLAVFTNLYPDHLDYHKTMEAYTAAKKKLFEKAKASIFNADSIWMGNGLTYGIEKGEIRAKDIRYNSDGTEFFVEGCLFQSELIGKFNVYNMLSAISVGVHLGTDLKTISQILKKFESAPARLERIGNVFIDFAHTGEALENVLQTLKEIAKGKVIVVFGCGGNRDPLRRISMAKAAEKWADLCIITTDNPRGEDPKEIISQIAAAFQKAPIIEMDRRKAIELAIQLAKPDDLILIAGKGHEQVQIFAAQTIPFDDRKVVREILKS